jgi:hypothetical protein
MLITKADGSVVGEHQQLFPRQALRDITAQETFPQSVVWPNEPE